MSINSFGHLFRFTTWGESHGPAIGAVVDGCPPGIPLSAEMIQPWLDRRKPGQNKYTTQRQEADEVEILSGVFEGQTTGTPIQLLIRNTDQRSKDYSEIAASYRPGHADYTYIAKYGIRDYRGGGRSSARETASRVAAGGVAREVLKALMPGVSIKGYMVQMGPHAIDRSRFDAGAIDDNPFWCPDPDAAEAWAGELDALRKSGNSVGAVIEVVASGVPAGLGAPLYAKLDSDLASAMMSINAVKGVEIGEGMNAAALTGVENADKMRAGNDGRPRFLSNHAGGILGGISSGQDIVVRFAVKPTSSILTPRKSVTTAGEEVDLVTKGRHDPCVGIRAVPVGEAMMALVLADHLLLHRGQNRTHLRDMRYLKFAFLALVALILITLAVTNREIVTIRLLPEGLGAALGLGFTATVPLFVVIFAAVLAGVILGFIWEWFREHRFRVEAAQKKKEATKLRAEVKKLRSSGETTDDEIIALLENKG